MADADSALGPYHDRKMHELVTIGELLAVAASVQGLEQPMATLTKLIRVTILINLLMVASELFTEFYTGGTHVSSAKYLFFGLHGKTALVPWT